MLLKSRICVISYKCNKRYEIRVTSLLNEFSGDGMVKKTQERLEREKTGF